MADPILTGVRRVQVVFQGKSGLPEDRYVNTFTFIPTTGFTQDPNDEITTMIEAFYNVPSIVTNAKLLAYYNSAVIESAQIRIYDLGQTPPRDPDIRPREWTFATTTQDVMPLEACVCVSWVTDKRGPRGRGRNYIGPLAKVATKQVDGVVQIGDAFKQTLQERASDLVNSTMQADLAVLSRMDGVARPVVGGWIDDALDTQRKRGNAATSRVTFGDYVLAA